VGSSAVVIFYKKNKTSWHTLEKLLVAGSFVSSVMWWGCNWRYFTICCIFNTVQGITESEVYIHNLSESAHMLKPLKDQSSLRMCPDIHSVGGYLKAIKNGIFWDVTPCSSCKNRRFRGI
jgi:hypothetical protein